MKFFYIILIFLFPNQSKTQSLYDPIIGENLKRDAKEIIELLNQRMAELLNSSITQLDYMSEKRMNEIDLALSNILYSVNDQRIKTLEDLDRQRLDALKRIDQILLNTIPSQQNINNFSALLTSNVQNIFNGLPFYSDKFMLTSISGTSQPFRLTSNYKIIFIGNIFNQKDIQVKVKVNQIEYDLKSVNINHTEIEILNSELMKYFHVDSIKRITIEITAIKKIKKYFKKDKLEEVFKYEGFVSLLPKQPFQYKLTQHLNKYEWSEIKEGQSIREQVAPRSRKNFTLDVGTNQRIVLDKTKYYDVAARRAELNKSYNECHQYGNGPILSAEQCRQWMLSEINKLGDWAGNAELFNDNKSIRRIYETKNFKEEAGFKIFYQDYILSKDLSNEILYFNDFTGKTIGFGSHICILNNDYVSYTLELKPFYSESFILTPVSQNKRGISISIESHQNFKRMVLDIDPNYFNL